MSESEREKGTERERGRGRENESGREKERGNESGRERDVSGRRSCDVVPGLGRGEAVCAGLVHSPLTVAASRRTRGPPLQ